MIPTGVSAIIFGVSIGNLFDSDNSILGNSDANEVAMFLCIAIGTLVGLALLIPAGLAHSAFKRQHPYVEDFYTESDRAAARKVLAIALIAGIALIMAGIAVNVWADETLHVDEGWPSTALLMFVAVGVWCIVFGGMQYGRLDIADYNKESEEQHVQENGTESIYDKGNGAVCGIIMITAPIVGLTLLFCFDGGPHGMFWMSWVIGGFLCAIASIVTGLIKSTKSVGTAPRHNMEWVEYWKPISQWNEEHGGRENQAGTGDDAEKRTASAYRGNARTGACTDAGGPQWSDIAVDGYRRPASAV